MAREQFDRDLRQLQDRLLALGSEVGHNIDRAVDALLRQDEILSQRLIDGDEEINREQIGLERDSLVLIARQQPTAGDLRLLASVMAIAGELERINDYSKGIAKITLLIGRQPLLGVAPALKPMADKARGMLERSLEAFSDRDVTAATSIYDEDDEVDRMYNQIYRRLIDLITGDRDHMDQATHLLWAAHNLERTGDRVNNICERIIFVVTGEIVESLEEMETPVG